MDNNCWNDIGVWGDRTCPKLKDEIHCRNCSVYGQVSQALLERAEPEGYTAEWTALTAQNRQQQADHDDRQSVTIFRLGQEWLALPADIFDQVRTPSPIHALPHSNSALLRGIVNVRGQLLPCVSLHALLSITMSQSLSSAAAWVDTRKRVSGSAASTVSTPTLSDTDKSYSRLMVIQQSREAWAFEVDELSGLHRCLRSEFRRAPAINSQCLENFTQSVLSWKDHQVSYLDAERLFFTLRQQAL